MEIEAYFKNYKKKPDKYTKSEELLLSVLNHLRAIKSVNRAYIVKAQRFIIKWSEEISQTELKHSSLLVAISLVALFKESNRVKVFNMIGFDSILELQEAIEKAYKDNNIPIEAIFNSYDISDKVYELIIYGDNK